MLDALNTFGNGLQSWWTGISASEPLRALMVALFCLIFMLVVVLFVIWMERKVSADIQNRVGPVRTGGPFGFLLQSLADALKLLIKEDLKPAGADRWPFYVAPYLVFLPAFMAYMILPFSATWVPQDVKIGILYYCAISSVPVLGIAIAGWASNNKWSLLGSLRAAAQLISYELPLAFAIICVVMLHGTLETGAIVANQWQHPWLTLLTLPALLIFMVAGLAEVSRAPFDLPEAESELVAGFNTEYSGMRFATFFLAEFSASFFIAALAVTLFLGGWSLWGIDTWFAQHVFGWHFHDMPSFLQFAEAHFWPGLIMKTFWFAVFLVKSFVVLWVLMWIKWTMPRLRIDQVLNFGWKVLLPASLACLLLLSIVGAALSAPKTAADGTLAPLYGVTRLELPALFGSDIIPGACSTESGTPADGAATDCCPVEPEAAK